MRKVTVLGSAAAFTLTVALPALAVLPTDVIVSPAGKGVVEFGADDEWGGGGGGDGGGGDGGGGDGGGGDGGGAPAADPAARPVAASPSRPLTAEEESRIAAGLGACVGAKIVSGTAVSGCFGSVPEVSVVPAGQPARPRVSVASVRQEAVDQIALTKPDLQASPCLSDADSCRGTVGVPVWLWVGEGDGGLPSESASATAGRFSIQATAKVSQVKWSLGDGQTTVCSGTGTKYDEAAHGWSAPECGFEHGWKKAGTYTLTATYVWDISWSGDQTGSATQLMSSTQQVTVGELQSVVSKN